MTDINEDQWLYGDSENTEEDSAEKSTPVLVINGETEQPPKPKEDVEMTPADAEEGQLVGEDADVGKEESTEAKVDGDEDEDSDEDDVCVVIGDIKSTPSAYSSSSFSMRKSGTGYTPASTDKSKVPQIGSFAAAEFEGPGTINGVPAFEFNLDSLEDKPWRKPGADLTDYFNYGFTEDTWRAYCDRQRRLRLNESGTGLASLGLGVGGKSYSAPSHPLTIPVAINDNSKYGLSGIGLRKAGPPPGRKVAGAIDVIGASTPSRRYGEKDTKESPIQVMALDRREFDTSVPPPNFEGADFTHTFYPPPPVPTETFYSGYEPTQDSQWNPRNQWDTPPPPPSHLSAPPSIKESTKDGGQDSRDSYSSSRGGVDGPDERERDRERDRDRERERDKDKDREERDRHRSHRRRSRSRSAERRTRRSHRSRSRSPSHRHRRKKSKKEKAEHSE